ncbi:MAG TPA: hypothetical protein VKK81_08370 [Candidatus Binatia bacterium]|nr:hypothetical protein [Candidatus Binatia bacterium]
MQRGGFRAFIFSGRVDQNQTMTASIGAMRELILVFHDEVEGLSQPVRAVFIPEGHPWMGRRRPRPAIAHQVLVTPGPDRPDAQIIQGGSGFALVFNARRAGLGNFHQVFPAQMTASLKALSNSTLGLLRNKITSTTAAGAS